MAAVMATAIYGVAAWQVAPSVPGGDEPHYLVITQSLLRDGDIRIENNHQRGDYLEYFPGTLRPDYRVRGRNGDIYSIHAPGLSALVAPAFLVGGYPGVVVCLVLLASAGSALVWRLAYAVTGRASAAWFAWTAVTCSTTSVFHSFTVYPDGPGGVIALTGVWALVRLREEAESGSERVRPWLLHGAALATLPWLHSRFAVLAGGLGALVLLRLSRTRNPAAKAAAFLAIPALSAFAWLTFFIAIYGTPDPSAPYGNEPGSFAFVPGGAAGLFFDQRFGLLAYAPVLAFGLGGLARMLRRPAGRALALELLFVLVPYLLVVTHFAMWWGGHSAPARFFAPVLPMLGVPLAIAWVDMRTRAARATAWAALAFTAFATAALVLVDGGRLAYNTRDAYAQWLEWLNAGLDFGRGLPAFWRGREGELYRDAAIWIGALGAGWALLRTIDRRGLFAGRGSFAAATAAVYALASMVALTTVWRVAGAPPTDITASQLDLLRRAGSERGALIVDIPTLRPVTLDRLPARLRIVPARDTRPGGAGRDDRPLYSVPSIPAGEYRLRFDGGDGAWIMVGIGRDQFAIRTEQLGTPPQPVSVTFPVDVRAIVVRGDEDARRRIRRLVVEPLSLVGPRDRLTTRVARQAVRYDRSTVFFLDDRSFPEPEGFWAGGARDSSVVLQPDTARPMAALLVRNGGAANDVTLETGQWRAAWRLAPGEERRVEIPLDTSRRAALLRVSSSSGFRPSEIEPGSRDTRFLGVWVRVLAF
jgi:hypothetical protein